MFKVSGDSVFVEVPFNEKHLAKERLGGTWSKSNQMWKFPLNYHSLKEIVHMFPRMKVDSEFIQLGQKLQGVRQKFLQLKNREDAVGDERLRPYQRADVYYLKHLPHAGVFNEPRTGKTPTMITVMKERDFKTALIVVPASLLLNWKKEMEVWNDTRKVFVYKGTKKQREKIEVAYTAERSNKCLVISKDLLKRELETLSKNSFDCMVVDESHFLRNETLQTEAIHKMAKNCKHRYALTGTPTVKHAKDVFGILRFLYPDKFTSKWGFYGRYFQIHDDMWNKGVGDVIPHRRAELEELIAFISCQRKRKEVMQWLPDKDYQTISVEMSSKQKKLYDAMERDFFIQDGDVEVDTMTVLAQLTRLRQLCLDPRLLGLDAKGAKTEAILDYIDSANEPIVIMSMFTSYLDLLKSEMKGKRIGMITGKMNATEKFEVSEKFQRGEIDVLLCNIISAGVGFTLDRGEVIIFPDKAWNPSDQEQAEDRITPTQEHKIHAHTILTFTTAGTVDERIDEILKTKKDLTEIVNSGGKNALRRLLG